MATMQERYVRNARSTLRTTQREYNGRLANGENPNSEYMRQLKRRIDGSQSTLDRYSNGRGRNTSTTNSNRRNRTSNSSANGRGK